MFYIFVLFNVFFTLIEGRYQFLSAVSGEVYEENYDYYNVTYEGTILLELISISGDCDLYVSQYTVNPTSDPHNNCLQSVTCGIDSVIIPKSFSRPLGIGIFGHPSHKSSQYILTVSSIEDSRDLFSLNSYSESQETLRTGINVPVIKKYVEKEEEEEEEEEEHFLWTFLKTFMKNVIRQMAEENILLSLL